MPRHRRNTKTFVENFFVIENVERTTINRDEHLLPIYYRSRKNHRSSTLPPSLCPPPPRRPPLPPQPKCIRPRDRDAEL